MVTLRTRHLTPDDLRGRRWRGYIRESTEHQARRETPARRQREDIARAADELGLVTSEPTWYERTGTGEEHSDELDRALADSGQYDVLLVFHSSRLGRNALEVGLVKQRAAAAGVVIYFVAQHMIAGARTTSLSEGVQAVIDEEENEQKRFWVSGGLRQRQLAGRWVGTIPYGYAKHMADRPDGSRGWDGTLEAQPDEAPVVRWIFEHAVLWGSAPAIAGALNREGHRTRPGNPWTRGVVRWILRNPVYVGQFIRYRTDDPAHYWPETDEHDGRRVIDAAIPVLVSRDFWAAAQTILGTPGGARAPSRPYPLSGVLRCARCQRRLTGMTNGSSRYYRCRARVEMALCDAPYLRADAAEQSFAAWLSGIHLPADWRERVAHQEVSAFRQAESDRRARLEGQLARLKQLYVLGDLSAGAYQAESRALKNELRLIVKPAIPDLVHTAQALSDLATQWMAGTREARAATARLLIEDGLVRDGTVTWVPTPDLQYLMDQFQAQAVAV